MEYEKKESLIKRFLNKIKNSSLGTIFSSNIDVPSDNELYNKITSDEGLSIEEAKRIELAFKQAKISSESYLDRDSKFKVDIDPQAPVSNISVEKGIDIELEK